MEFIEAVDDLVVAVSDTGRHSSLIELNEDGVLCKRRAAGFR